MALGIARIAIGVIGHAIFLQQALSFAVTAIQLDATGFFQKLRQIMPVGAQHSSG